MDGKPNNNAIQLHAQLQKDGFEGSVEDFVKTYSDPKNAEELVNALRQNYGYEGDVNSFMKDYIGGAEPPKKKEATTLSSQNAGVPSNPEIPTGRDLLAQKGQSLKSSGPTSFQSPNTVPSKTYNLTSGAQYIVNAKNDLKSAQNDLIYAKINKGVAENQDKRLQDFNMQQGGVIDLPQAQTNLDKAQVKYDEAYERIAKNAPEGVDKNTYVQKTLNTASVADEINGLQNELAGVGLSVDDYVEKVKNDAVGFLSPEEKKYFEAYKTGDKAAIEKARIEFDKDIDTRLGDINNQLISLAGKSGFTSDGEPIEDKVNSLKAEKDKLLQRKENVINTNPNAAYKKLTSAVPEFLDADKDIKLTPQQKLDVAYSYTYRKFEKLANKLGIDVKDAIAGKNDVFLFPEFRGTMEGDLQEFNRLRDALVDAAPVVQINRSPKGLGTTDTFLDMFARKAGNSLNRNFHIENTRDVGTNVLDVLNRANVGTQGGNLETNTGIKQLLNTAMQKPNVKEQVADVLGFIVPVALLSATGEGELAVLNTLTKARRAGVALNELNAIGSTILKTPVLGKMVKSALPAYLGAQTAGTQEAKDELTFSSLAGGSLVEQAASKLPLVKYLSGALTKLFGGGETAANIANKIVEYTGRGAAQIPAEFTEETINNYSNSRDFQEFKNRMTEQFGDSTQNAIFALSAFTLGSGVLGGTSMGEAVVDEAKKTYDKLSPEEKAYVDNGINQNTEDKRGDLLDALAVAAPEMDKSTKESAIKGLDDIENKLNQVEGKYKIEGDVDGKKIVLEGETEEDLQNDKQFIATANNIFKEKLEADPQETIDILTNGETETTPTEESGVQEQPSQETGVGVAPETEEISVEKILAGDQVTETKAEKQEVQTIKGNEQRVTTSESEGSAKTDIGESQSEGGEQAVEEGEIRSDEELEALEKHYEEEAKKAGGEYADLSYKEQIIHQNVGKVDEAQLRAAVGEKVFNDDNMAFRFTKKGAQGIDQRAQELSEQFGVEITPQDIVDYFVDRTATKGKYLKNKIGAYKGEKALQTKKAELLKSGLATAAESTSDIDMLMNPDYIESLREFPLSGEEVDTIKDYLSKIQNDENAKRQFRAEVENVVGTSILAPQGFAGKRKSITTKAFSSNTSTQREGLRELPKEVKEKVVKINEAVNKDTVAKLDKALDDKSEVLKQKYGLVKIC